MRDGGPRGHPRTPGREGRDRLRPAQPVVDPTRSAPASRRRTATGTAMPERVELHIVAFEGLLVPARGDRRDRAVPTTRSSSSTTTSTSPCAPDAPATASGPSATPCSCGSSTSTSSTPSTRWKGFYMYRNLFACTSATAPTRWCARSPTRSPRRSSRMSPIRGGRAEASNVIRAIRSARGMRSIPGSDPPARRLAGHDRSGDLTLSKPDLVVVGSGFFGLTIAERCASELGLASSSSSGAPTSAATPTARSTPRPGSRCTCTARTSSTPPTSACGSTSTASRRSPATSTGSSRGTRGRSTPSR